MLKVIKMYPDAILPTKAYSGDLGYDLYSMKNYALEPGTRKLIQTGIAIQFPEGWGGFLKDRSGFSSSSGGFIHAGVIDHQYRGEIMILMYNSQHDTDIYINKGQKIAQLVLIPVADFDILEVDKFDSTDRGEQGFGSTG